MKIAIFFGGQSNEHDVSIASGTSVIYNIDKEKYQVYPIYISKEGKFYFYGKDVYKIKPLKVGAKLTNLKEIENIIEYLKDIDVCIPILHGKYGEDGSIQGLFKLLNKKYVGCDILSSAICMDKVTTKILLEGIGIKVTPYLYIKKNGHKYLYFDGNFNSYLLSKNELLKLAKEKIGYPLFVKASNSGSSIGTFKVEDASSLISAITEASLIDEKILIEKSIEGRELEVAILGNNEVICSPVGEIKTSKDYYSYKAKYNDKSSKTELANLNLKTLNEIKDIAKRAYRVCSCKGLSRVDFFLESKTNKIILNEINTMPGFTSISMYPELFMMYGYDYKTLIDKLIILALS